MRARFGWSARAIRACRARLQLAQGDLAAVEQWAQEKGQTLGFQAPEQEKAFSLLQQQEEALVLARFSIAQRRGEAALRELAPWKEKAQEQGRKRSVLKIQILEALAHAVRQEHSMARSILIQTLKLAQSENDQRIFLDEGSAMEVLLKTLLPELREAALISYVRILLRAFAQEPGAQPTREAQPPERMYSSWTRSAINSSGFSACWPPGAPIQR